MPIAHPIFCMYLTELNMKLLNVKIKLRKIVITFVETVLLGFLSLVYKDFTSNVTSKLSSGTFSI